MSAEFPWRLLRYAFLVSTIHEVLVMTATYFDMKNSSTCEENNAALTPGKVNNVTINHTHKKDHMGKQQSTVYTLLQQRKSRIVKRSTVRR